MRSLQEYLAQDARVAPGIDTQLTPEQYRYLVQVAAPIFAEGSIRGALPVDIVNDPGVLQSRHVKVIDMADAQHGMTGTGGVFDRLDASFVDQPAYAIWQNVEVPYREQLASARISWFNILEESARRMATRLSEKENQFIAVGLGPVKGISTTTGIDSYAGAAWTTQGQFWKDVIKARGRIKANKIPVDNLAVLVNPTDEANAWQTFTNTATPQSALVQLEKFLPGGVHTTTFLPAGKAYFYASRPDVLELKVFQDLSVKPLPKIDEDERVRARIIDALHVKSPLGVVEVTGV